jgi:Protein of Unknown function (DUF2784)
MWWYQFLNYFFFSFHTALILFNSFGWIFRKTRKWNLISLLITAFSWFGLGIWYGWGYCFCTDWHWQVRVRLGYHDNVNSYTQFLALKLTGVNFDPHLVDTVTAAVFFISLILSVLFNLRDRQKKMLIRKKQKSNAST